MCSVTALKVKTPHPRDVSFKSFSSVLIVEQSLMLSSILNILFRVKDIEKLLSEINCSELNSKP